MVRVGNKTVVLGLAAFVVVGVLLPAPQDRSERPPFKHSMLRSHSLDVPKDTDVREIPRAGARGLRSVQETEKVTTAPAQCDAWDCSCDGFNRVFAPNVQRPDKRFCNAVCSGRHKPDMLARNFRPSYPSPQFKTDALAWFMDSGCPVPAPAPPRCDCEDAVVVPEKGEAFVAYIKHDWQSTHLENFYTWIHYLCDGPSDIRASHPWPLPPEATRSKKIIYLGPTRQVQRDARKIWSNFNRTECELRIGEPVAPHFTVHTTFREGEDEVKYVNKSRHVIICHWADQCGQHVVADGESNVFGLSPAMPRWILPSYFPPFYTRRVPREPPTKDKIPVFLVLGGKEDGKRDWFSLLRVLYRHRERKFILRIVKKGPIPEELSPYMHNSQLEFKSISSNHDLMMAMDNVTYIMPLVDDTNFHRVYQDGRKLTSTVMWAFGFDLPLVIWRPLADLYNVTNMATHTKSTNLGRAFLSALNEFEKKQKS
eukprot:m.17714 g.17714  ORF g.17714 m.17714 type:complete len:482 (+) comp5213_c0_seq1:91-1536(+)